MAVLDFLHSIGNSIGLFRVDEDTEETENASIHGTADNQQPDMEPYAQPSNYGTGNSYVRAGAKPRTPYKTPEPEPVNNQFERHPTKGRRDNVIPMPERDDRDLFAPPREAHAAQQSTRQGSTIIFTVHRKDDSEHIITYLLTGMSVVLNFEEVDDQQRQRVLDFIGGATFALRGTVERISSRNYLVVPAGIEIVRTQSEPTHTQAVWATR